MCGIVALYVAGNDRVDRSVLLQMRDIMSHRGPDDSGVFCQGPVGLGHRRLSIIDLETGHQPMSDASGDVWLVFNGEIYNFQDLRRELVASGYPFKTKSDTEVILALYRRDGEEFVERLNGIFAIAIWDSRDKTLLLVRDRVGVKPLYVWRNAGLVAAASEVKALLAHPRIRAEVDLEAIPEYLAFRQLAGKRTLFRGVEVVAPGEIMKVKNGMVRTRRYWTLPPCGEPESTEPDDLLERLDDLLRDAAQKQMISDVPIGTFASGGVDSSLVTKYVAEKSGPHLNTFCIGLTDPELDERSYAELVAKRTQSEHRNLLVESRQLADCLPSVVWHHDEPLTHPNTLPIFLLSSMAKQHVKVVLTGEGCDEFFGGYPRYRVGAILDLLGKTGRGAIGSVARLLRPASPRSRLGKMLGGLQRGAAGTVMEASRYVSDGELGRLLIRDFAAITEARRPTEEAAVDVVGSLLAQDQRNYLPPILNRLDKASMAFGLEARVPFLDHRVIEFASRVPSSLKVTRSHNKYLVKKLALRHLPKQVVFRRKSGLALPLKTWLKDVEGMGRYLEMLCEPRSEQRPYLRAAELRKLIGEHRDGQADHSEILWGLLNLEVWHRIHIEAASFCRPSTPPVVESREQTAQRR